MIILVNTKKIITWLIFFSVIATPLACTHSADQRDFQFSIAAYTALVFLMAGTIDMDEKKKQCLSIFITFCAVFLALFLFPKPELPIFLAKPADGIKGFSLFSIGDTTKIYWLNFFYGMVFVCFSAMISSLKHIEDLSERIISSMIMVGTFISSIMLLQAIGINQFFTYVSEHATATQSWVTGTLGHPTLASAFLAPLYILSVAKMKRSQSVIIGLALCATGSQIAIGSVIVVVFAYGIMSRKKALAVIAGMVIIASMIYASIDKRFVEDSGRFGQWRQIASAIHKSKYPITGHGLGSFQTTYRINHKSTYLQAHNEYLETTYDLGIVGLALLLLMIVATMWRALLMERLDLMAAFLSICLCAGGTFVWHLGPHIIYTCVIAGLIWRGETRDENVSASIKEANDSFWNDPSKGNVWPRARS